MARRIIILTEGQSNPLNAKTAVSVIRYAGEEVVGLLDSTQRGATSEQLLGVGGDLPVLGSLDDLAAQSGPGAAIADADTLLIGVAPAGGKLPPEMREPVLHAIQRGWTIESGLHQFLCNDPEFVAAAKISGAVINDVRKNSETDVATRQGIDESCLRIHTVGNDCAVGKMVASIEIARGLSAAGHDAKFVATGQTGIMIEGDGCPIDCVVADFINGAAENLVRANQHHKIAVFEGQGTLSHPSYSAVTLGLLHGCIPDGLVMVYEVGRTEFHGRGIPLVPMQQLMALNESAANMAHACQFIGIAMNTRRCKTQDEVEAERERVSKEFGLPVCDVIRDGPSVLVDAVLKLKKDIGK